MKSTALSVALFELLTNSTEISNQRVTNGAKKNIIPHLNGYDITNVRITEASAVALSYFAMLKNGVSIPKRFDTLVNNIKETDLRANDLSNIVNSIFELSNEQISNFPSEIKEAYDFDLNLKLEATKRRENPPPTDSFLKACGEMSAREREEKKAPAKPITEPTESSKIEDRVSELELTVQALIKRLEKIEIGVFTPVEETTPKTTPKEELKSVGETTPLFNDTSVPVFEDFDPLKNFIPSDLKGFGTIETTFEDNDPFANIEDGAFVEPTDSEDSDIEDGAFVDPFAENNDPFADIEDTDIEDGAFVEPVEPVKNSAFVDLIDSAFIEPVENVEVLETTEATIITVTEPTEPTEDKDPTKELINSINDFMAIEFVSTKDIKDLIVLLATADLLDISDSERELIKVAKELAESKLTPPPTKEPVVIEEEAVVVEEVEPTIDPAKAEVVKPVKEETKEVKEVFKPTTQTYYLNADDIQKIIFMNRTYNLPNTREIEKRCEAIKGKNLLKDAEIREVYEAVKKETATPVKAEIVAPVLDDINISSIEEAELKQRQAELELVKELEELEAKLTEDELSAIIKNIDNEDDYVIAIKQAVAIKESNNVLDIETIAPTTLDQQERIIFNNTTRGCTDEEKREIEVKLVEMKKSGTAIIWGLEDTIKGMLNSEQAKEIEKNNVWLEVRAELLNPVSYEETFKELNIDAHPLDFSKNLLRWRPKETLDFYKVSHKLIAKFFGLYRALNITPVIKILNP